MLETYRKSNGYSTFSLTDDTVSCSFFQVYISEYGFFNKKQRYTYKGHVWTLPEITAKRLLIKILKKKEIILRLIYDLGDRYLTEAKIAEAVKGITYNV